MTVEEILRDRDARYGNFTTQAACAQRLKFFIHEAPRWFDLGMAQREALDHILTKISRIVHGDPEYRDNWDDISGFATLAAGWTNRAASTEPAGGDSQPVTYSAS